MKMLLLILSRMLILLCIARRTTYLNTIPIGRQKALYKSFFVTAF